ncbi:MAG: hypothetical protein QXV04_03840 [Desulfurococcaceae archaeon]
MYNEASRKCRRLECPSNYAEPIEYVEKLYEFMLSMPFSNAVHGGVTSSYRSCWWYHQGDSPEKSRLYGTLRFERTYWAYIKID